MVNWKFWPGGHRRLADLAGGHLDVLLLQGVDHVVGGHVAGGQFFGIEPGPHAVVALAEEGHVADARQPQQLVLDLDRGVVRQVEIVAEILALLRPSPRSG